jgi:5'(3')-deoxyribonucleotidase
MRTIFVDLDGVLADCNGLYTKHFGVSLPQRTQPIDDKIFWGTVCRYPGNEAQFFRDLPMLDDAQELMSNLERLRGPHSLSILTGCPTHRRNVAQAKREWVLQHFGSKYQVITCPSADKCNFGQPGDVLIDDWDRWQFKWEQMGGIFVLHKSAYSSLKRVKEILANGRSV